MNFKYLEVYLKKESLIEILESIDIIKKDAYKLREVQSPEDKLEAENAIKLAEQALKVLYIGKS